MNIKPSKAESSYIVHGIYLNHIQDNLAVWCTGCGRSQYIFQIILNTILHTLVREGQVRFLPWPMFPSILFWLSRSSVRINCHNEYK